MKNSSKIRDYFHNNPIWKICNIELYQNGFYWYIGPSDPKTIITSFEQYVEKVSAKNPTLMTKERCDQLITDLKFVIEDPCNPSDHVRGFVAWQKKGYVGRTHFMFVFTDHICIDKELLGVIVHESTHCVDYFMLTHQLERPANKACEQSAYIMQYIIRRILSFVDMSVIYAPSESESDKKEIQPRLVEKGT